MRSPSSILAVSFALACASTHGTQVFAQSEVGAGCGLEQRLAPWRATCHSPFHFAGPVPAVPESSPTRLSRAATLSVFGRSAFPSDRDNGSVWTGKGLSIRLSAGIGGRLGPFRYGIFPTVHWAQNVDLVVADTAVASYSAYLYTWLGPGIDWPQRMGSDPSGRISPGQSFFEITAWAQTALGVSTENIWWGPSKRYPMLLGATSSGFPHVYARSPTAAFGPVRTIVRVVFGRLNESEHFDEDAGNDHNLLGALRLEVELGDPPGLQIAVTSMVRQSWDPDLTFGNLLQKLVPRSTAQAGAGAGQADGIGAVTFVLPVTSLGMRLHGTWGRGDFFLDTEDILTEPDHNQFWAVGLHQEWRGPNNGVQWALSVEHASSAASPPQFSVRSPIFSTGVYRHDGNQGHTHLGQLLGASIGPGARATYLALDRTLANRLLGVLVERVFWDIDAYSVALRDQFPDGQDREWLFGGRFGTDLNISGVPSLRLDAFGGASMRWNRQYVRFTGDLLDYPERETNFWLDLRLAWTPDRGEARK